MAELQVNACVISLGQMLEGKVASKCLRNFFGSDKFTFANLNGHFLFALFWFNHFDIYVHAHVIFQPFEICVQAHAVSRRCPSLAGNGLR